MENRIQAVMEETIVSLEQGIGYVLGDGPERHELYALDCIVLHAVVKSTEMEVGVKAWGPPQKQRKTSSAPPSKATSKMLWVMDRKGRPAAVALSDEVWGHLQKKCPEAFQAGTGVPMAILLICNVGVFHTRCNTSGNVRSKDPSIEPESSHEF